MKRVLILLLSAAPALAQFDFDEPGVTKGRIAVSGTEEITEYGTNGEGARIEVKRTRRKVVTSSELLLRVVIPDVEAQFKNLAQAKQKLGNDLGHTSAFVYGNNFSRT